MLPSMPSQDERRAARDRARTIYQRIEKDLPDDSRGSIVAIEVESGDYFIGRTLEAATAAAQKKRPGKPLYLFRVGHRSVLFSR